MIAPAGPSAPERVKAGAAFLEQFGHEVILGPCVTASPDIAYLAASATAQAAELTRFWLDPSIDLILCARGGYGSARILPLLDWDALRSRSALLLGYSDISALGLAMMAKNVTLCVSAPMLTTWARPSHAPLTLDSCHAASRHDRETRALRPRPRESFRALRFGVAAGPVVPVTLAVLVTLLGTEFTPDLTGAMLVLEDINEPVYKLDRYLTQLEQTGQLQRLAGLVLGDFTRCGNRHDRAVLFRRFAPLVPGPVIMGLPFGHRFPRISLPFGANLSVRAVDGEPVTCQLD